MQHTLKHRSTDLSNKASAANDTHEQVHAILDIDITKSPVNQWIPAVDISETNDRFIIQADLPGIKTSEVDVKLRNGVLTFKGRRNTKENGNEKNYFRLERASGSFSRRFSLPDSASSERAKISSDHGVFTITIPKKTVIRAHRHSSQLDAAKLSDDKPLSAPKTTTTRLMSNYWGL